MRRGEVGRVGRGGVGRVGLGGVGAGSQGSESLGLAFFFFSLHVRFILMISFSQDPGLLVTLYIFKFLKEM